MGQPQVLVSLSFCLSVSFNIWFVYYANFALANCCFYIFILHYFRFIIASLSLPLSPPLRLVANIKLQITIYAIHAEIQTKVNFMGALGVVVVIYFSSVFFFFSGKPTIYGCQRKQSGGGFHFLSVPFIIISAAGTIFFFICVNKFLCNITQFGRHERVAKSSSFKWHIKNEIIFVK